MPSISLALRLETALANSLLPTASFKHTPTSYHTELLLAGLSHACRGGDIFMGEQWAERLSVHKGKAE